MLIKGVSDWRGYEAGYIRCSTAIILIRTHEGNAIDEQYQHKQRITNNRGMNVLPYIAVSVLLLCQCNLGHAQWAQTFGWGGAGNGKRSDVNDPTACNMDLQLVKLMSALIQHELKRLKTCGEQKIPRDLLDI